VFRIVKADRSAGNGQMLTSRCLLRLVMCFFRSETSSHSSKPPSSRVGRTTRFATLSGSTPLNTWRLSVLLLVRFSSEFLVTGRISLSSILSVESHANWAIRIGRRWGLIQDASIMLLGLVMLVAAWGVNQNGWVICYAWSLFIYGIGVGKSSYLS
jgi:hypothetical protein